MLSDEVPLEGGDPLLSSKGESSKKRKGPQRSSVAGSKKKKKKKQKCIRSYAPSVPLSYADDGGTCEEDTLECAQTALSFWNKKSLSKKKQGPEYELVDALSCLHVRYPLIYHCNFTARPKDESEAESELFFAELRYKEEKDGKLTLIFRFCSIVGPCGTVTGLCGCQICKLDPGLVQHPKRGKFFKKKLGAIKFKRRSRKS